MGIAKGRAAAGRRNDLSGQRKSWTVPGWETAAIQSR
jgi:hypothetical protein